MLWITCHLQELQAISALVIAFLTLILIVMTGFYATANWRTMRLMNADVRFRLKPIPHVGLNASSPWKETGQDWILTVRCEHAPMVLLGIEIAFHIGGGKQFEHFHSFKTGETVHPQQSAHGYDLDIKLPASAKSWIMDFSYRDLSGLLYYTTTFDANGFFSESSPFNPRTPWNRIRLWRHRRASKKLFGIA
jgi:hypothetical protein